MFKARSRPRCRPQLEFLEDRLTPSGDMVLQWNDIARGAIRTAGTPAPAASRILAITHAAVYDAVNTLDRTHEVYLVDALAHPKASPEAAVAAAAGASARDKARGGPTWCFRIGSRSLFPCCALRLQWPCPPYEMASPSR